MNGSSSYKFTNQAQTITNDSNEKYKQVKHIKKAYTNRYN